MDGGRLATPRCPKVSAQRLRRRPWRLWVGLAGLLPALVMSVGGVWGICDGVQAALNGWVSPMTVLLGAWVDIALAALGTAWIVFVLQTFRTWRRGK